MASHVLVVSDAVTQALSNATHLFSFDAFAEAFQAFHKGALPLPSVSFLEWFIGFYEGDGSLHVATRDSSVVLTIVQSALDLDLLYSIRDTFGVGNVSLHSDVANTWHFRVEAKEAMHLMMTLLNGNMVIPSKLEQYLVGLDAFNLFISKGLIILPTITAQLSMVLPSLSTAWFSGFTDAEGCFSCSFLAGVTAFRIRFLIAQAHLMNRPVLLSLIGMFKGGAVHSHSVEDVYEYGLSGYKNTKLCFAYFDSHPLRTRKADSYRKWRILHEAIGSKEHLNPVRRAELKAMAAEVNL